MASNNYVNNTLYTLVLIEVQLFVLSSYGKTPALLRSSWKNRP
jgi:hypothetical protein